MPKLDEQIKTLAGYFAADCEPDGKLTLQLEVEHFLTRSDGQPPAFADVQAALRDLQQQTDAPIITDGEYFGYSGPALTATLGPACQLCISLAPLRDVQDIGIITLTQRDVVRHQLVQKIIEAYEKASQPKQTHGPRGGARKGGRDGR